MQVTAASAARAPTKFEKARERAATVPGRATWRRLMPIVIYALVSLVLITVTLASPPGERAVRLISADSGDRHRSQDQGAGQGAWRNLPRIRSADQRTANESGK